MLFLSFFLIFVVDILLLSNTFLVWLVGCSSSSVLIPASAVVMDPPLELLCPADCHTNTLCPPSFTSACLFVAVYFSNLKMYNEGAEIAFTLF